MVDKKVKKQIDQEITNTLLDDFDKFEHMLMKHWKLLFGAGVMVVLAIGLTMLTIKSIKAKEAKQSAVLVNAQKNDEILAAIAKYPDNKTVFPVKFKLAQKYLASTEGKKEDNIKKALDIYTEIANDEKAPKILAGLALNRKASILESEKKPQEALKIYQELAELNGVPSDLKCKAYYNAGSIALNAEKQDKKLALQMFEKVVELAPKNSMRNRIATSLVADIKSSATVATEKVETKEVKKEKTTKKESK